MIPFNMYMKMDNMILKEHEKTKITLRNYVLPIIVNSSDALLLLPVMLLKAMQV